MGKIFSGAQRVIVWISNNPAIASMFRYLRDYFQDDLRVYREFDRNHWNAFHDFRDDVYWERVWVSGAKPRDPSKTGSAIIP